MTQLAQLCFILCGPNQSIPQLALLWFGLYGAGPCMDHTWVIKGLYFFAVSELSVSCVDQIWPFTNFYSSVNSKNT